MKEEYQEREIFTTVFCGDGVYASTCFDDCHPIALF
jgi:hypothetical protein